MRPVSHCSKPETGCREIIESLRQDWYRNNSLVGHAQAAKSEALRQVKALGYAGKYRGRGEPVLLVGAEFGRVERNVVEFEVD